jgi:hydroxymethylbilane synthase
MGKVIRIGTRESELAVWQATEVKRLLLQHGFESELVYIKSEGDIDLQTPLYEMGVQGIFTKSLDTALLNNKIDIAVHSMKDVPTQLPKGIIQAAVLKRGNVKDIFVPHPKLKDVDKVFALGKVKIDHIKISVSGGKEKDESTSEIFDTGDPIEAIIATSSVRRKAQWLFRYRSHKIESLRGNVNTRLKKLEASDWHGAIFAAAGLERINLRPSNAVELNWMIPAPAQGAIMVACREEDSNTLDACVHFNDADTAFCTKIEREFLRELMGGCSTPISALAEIINDEVHFKGGILSLDGTARAEYGATTPLWQASHLGKGAAEEILRNGGKEIIEGLKNGK